MSSSYTSVISCLKLLVLIGLVSFFFSSCKEENGGRGGDSSNPIEAAYFEDYDSPTYKWGYIDVNGRKVLKAKWDALKEMQDPLTAANYEGKWGYIDVDGKEKIPYKYKQATRFQDQRAFVQDFYDKWLLLDVEGHVVDTTDYTQVNTFQDGHCVVEKFGLKGVINAEGKEILPIEYNTVKIAGDKFIVSKNGLSGIVNKNEVVVPMEYDKIYMPNDGLFRFRKDRKYGYLDQSGKVVSPRLYDKANNFEGKYASVFYEGQYHLINSRFQLIKSMSVDNLKSAGSGLWKYKQNNKWGLMDTKGMVLIKPRYELVNKYSSGLIAVSNDDLWGYCDSEGKEVIPTRYPLAWDFYDGRARFIYDRGVGFIDKAGKIVIDDDFIEVRDFSNGKARFQTYR